MDLNDEYEVDSNGVVIICQLTILKPSGCNSKCSRNPIE